MREKVTKTLGQKLQGEKSSEIEKKNMSDRCRWPCQQMDLQTYKVVSVSQIMTVRQRIRPRLLL